LIYRDLGLLTVDRDFMATTLSLKSAIALLVVCVALQRVQAQGTVWYTIRIPEFVVGHVYGPEVLDPSLAKVGNTASETPSGTQFYTGPLLGGSGWSAQLFAVKGSGKPENSLLPVATSVTTFRTGTIAGGTFPSSTQTIPGIFWGETGTFQLRAWDNQGGTLTSWLAAEPQWLNGSIAAGKSILFDIQAGGGVGLPADMLGFRSFNVYWIPEPSTTALAALGVAALLLLRRRLGRP